MCLWRAWLKHKIIDPISWHINLECISNLLALLNFRDQVDMSAVSSQFHSCPFQVFHLKKRRENGIYKFLFAGILKSTCYIDVRWFPFDVQKCDLKFGSWTHNGWLLDLQMLDADISNYISNGEWDLVGKLAFLNMFNVLKQCFLNFHQPMYTIF